MNIQGTHKNYMLSAMVVHIGSALEGGHYIAYVMVNGHWFEMNDKQVYKYVLPQYNCLTNVHVRTGNRNRDKICTTTTTISSVLCAE